MKRSLLPLTVLIAFGLSMGYYAYRAAFPAAPREYVVGGDARMMSYPEPHAENAHLYLRRTWHMTQRPEHAWIELLGHDEISVFVNGQRVAGRERAGLRRMTGVLIDITPWIEPGKNCIAIYAKQLTLNRCPKISVRGAYTSSDGTTHLLDHPELWRVSNTYDRHGTYWYDRDFDDGTWVAPRIDPSATVWASIDVPPRTIQTALDAPWIVAASETSGRTVMARRFRISSPPREGWLRLTTNAAYRLAVNGFLVDDDQASLGTLPPYAPRQVTYDISPLLNQGVNVVSVVMARPPSAARLRADLEAICRDGTTKRLQSDSKWSATNSTSANWFHPTLDEADGWRQCNEDTTFAEIPAWRTPREVRAIQYGWQLRAWRVGQFVLCVVAVMLLALLGSLAVGRLAAQLAGGASTRVYPQVAWLALLPSTLVAASVYLLQHDPMFSYWPFFQWNFLWLLLIAVVAQWFCILFLSITFRRLASGEPEQPKSGASGQDKMTTHRGSNTPNDPRHWDVLKYASLAALMCMFGLGLGLRLSQLTAEPIHHDEVGAYAMTRGVLDNGLPGGQVHDDLRYGVVATSELVYYPMALAGLIFDNPLHVIRVPAMIFSLATVMLAYYVGTQCFGRVAGLQAAVFMALSPYMVGMATFGRYFSQLQLLTLLTTYLTFRAVHTTHGVRKGYLWGATASFICMYFSWEGSGILGPPLAVAVLWHRRRHLKSLFCSPSLYGGTSLVVAAALFQNSHRVIQQTQRMWYGTGISGLSLKPMWRYPLFDPEYYLMESSWIRCAAIPMFLLAVALLLCIRHPLRRRLQFFLIVLLGTAGLMGALLPLRSGRYSYHLTVLMAIVASAVIAAWIDSILRVGRGLRIPDWCRVYAAAIALLLIVTISVFATGQWVRIEANEHLMTLAYDVDQLRFPDWEGPMRRLQREQRPGDIVISHMPHAAEYTMHQLNGGDSNPRDRWRVDYWLQTAMILQSSLGDEQLIPRDRRSGAEMIVNLDQLKQIFATHDRIWYVTARNGQNRINDKEVSEFLRNNMDVVHEDFVTTLLLRDKNHRPASVQVEDDEKGKEAREFYLR